MAQLTPITQERLRLFKAKFKEYCRRAEVSRPQMAAHLGICSGYFNEKIRGYYKTTFFTPKQVAQIVDYLATHEAFYTEDEKLELLQIAYPVENSEAARDWFNRAIKVTSSATSGPVNFVLSKPSSKISTAANKTVERPKPKGTRRVVKSPKRSAPLFSAPDNLFIGRDKELNEVVSLLSAPGDMAGSSRLVTLSGIGGVGKTRLAREAANELVAARVFKDGVKFIDLSRIKPGKNATWLVASQLANILELTLPDVTEQYAERNAVTNELTLTAILTSYLRSKNMLIVLDNFEQLLNDATAGLVTSLLAACPKLKVIVTSREILRVYGERVIRLSGLTVPPVGEHELAKVVAYPAVTILAARLQEIQADFELTEENVEVITQICHFVSGLPLALEIAARHIPYFSLETLRDTLLFESESVRQNSSNGSTSNFNFLASQLGSPRSLPTRHKSLQAVISSSFARLTSQEKSLLNSLALSRATLTLETVTTTYSELCRNGVINNSSSEFEKKAIELLGSLIDKSLVQVEKVVSLLNDGTRQVCTRYTMSNIITRYFYDRLMELNNRVQVELEEIVESDCRTELEHAQFSLVANKHTCSQEKSASEAVAGKLIATSRKKKTALEFITVNLAVRGGQARNNTLWTSTSMANRVNCGLSPPIRVNLN